MRNINQLKAGSIISYINILVGCIIPVFYTPIMLSILGQKEYGTYALANSIIGYLSILSLGMANSVVRYVTKCKCNNDHDGVEKVSGLFITIFCSIMILVIVCGFVLTGCSGAFFGKGLTNSELDRLKQLMVIMTFSTAMSFPTITYSALVIAYEKYVFRRLVELIGTILPVLLNLLVLYGGWGSIGIAMVALIMQVFTFPVYVYYCAKVLHIKPQFCHMPLYLLKDIFSYTFFIFLSMVVDMLYWATDKVLIGSMIGTVAVAVYNVGGTFTQMMQNMATAISSVFVPRIMTMVEKDKNIAEMSELMIRIGRIQYMLVALMLSGYIVFGRSFIHFWAGDPYQDAYIIALLTMVPLAVPLIQNIAYNVIVAQNRHRFRAIIYTVIAVINLISTIIIIPKFGIIGAAVCTSVAFLFGNGIVMNLFYYKKIGLDIPEFWKNIVRLSIVPIAFIIVFEVIIKWILPIRSLGSFLIYVIVYTILYCLCMLGFMNQYEKNLIIGFLKKICIRKNR